MKRNRWSPVLVWTPLLALFLCVTLDGPPSDAAGPATFRYVLDDGGIDAGLCDDSQSPCDTILYALSQADVGDTIRVAHRFNPAVYLGPVTIDAPITLEGGWNATSTASGLLWQRPSPCEAFRTTIDAQGTGRAVSIADYVDATIDCFTITGGDATGLGGSGALGYDTGGGIHSYFGETIVSDCIITGNVASRSFIGLGGGVGFVGGDVTLQGNVIQGNTAATTNSGYGGGAYFRHMASAIVSDNKVLKNVACDVVGYGRGGGIATQFGATTLQDNSIYRNTAAHGGGVWAAGAPGLLVYPSITDCLIHQNVATTDGGGIHVAYAGHAVLSGNEVYLNEAGEGGGLKVSLSPTATLENNRIYANTADYGAGVHLNGSDGTTISEGLITDNTAAGLGGGLWIGSSSGVTLRNNIIADNDVIGSATGTGAGAFLFLGSTARLLHTTLAQNNAPPGHAALHITDGSTAWMTNTIVASNTVGIYVGTGCLATMEATLWGQAPGPIRATGSAMARSTMARSSSMAIPALWIPDAMTTTSAWIPTRVTRAWKLASTEISMANGARGHPT
jgi:hypothetical protein